ncbi:hypothetical protein F6455_04410 [Proteobacteria bacterium 005FR1]|nr:hypothetical protein [Proteobacteria bacterium 005FR1]
MLARPLRPSTNFLGYGRRALSSIACGLASKGRSIALIASIVAGLIFASSALAQDTDSRAMPSRPAAGFVPPGFESLLEPQTTLVDIYMAGEFLASQLATFTAEEITFSAPQAIVDRIPLLLDARPVLDALTGPIPTNLEFVCQYQGQADCGSLTPDVAGIIFNEGQFRADLFVNSDLLAVRSAGHRKYLPASDGGWSWLQTVNGAYAGTQGEDRDTYAIGSSSILAFRENRLQLTGTHSSEEGTAVDTAAVRRDWQGMEYQLGYFRSNSGSFQFMSDSPIRGLRVASSLDTREDLRQTSGNELQVFLDSRSEVSLYKDDRLVSSRFYDAGNQILDTSQLPGGAYDVTIRIRDSSGRVQEETRFYIKSSLLPPADQALYFLEIGELLDPEDDSGFAAGVDLPLLRAGYHGRLSDQLGFLAGFSQVDTSSSLEMGLTHLGRWHDLSVGGFFGGDARKGARFNVRSRFSNIYFSANYRRVWNDQFDPQDPSDLFGESSTQASLTATTLLPVGRFEVGGRVNRRDEDALETYTARYEFPRLRFADSEMLMGLQFNREEGRNMTLFTMQMRLNGDYVTAQLRPEYRRSDVAAASEDELQTNGVLSWQDRQLLEDQDLRIDLRGHRQDGLESVGAELDYAAQSGRLRLQSERIDDGIRTTTRHNGNIFTSFMVNGQTAKLGGRDQSQSALLIEIDGELRDASFEVLVDGSPRGLAYPGRTTAINLRPYETYSVRLRQRGSSFAEYDQGEKRVTLYPGNVVTLAWPVAELNVVFGRVLNQHGEPVANALIRGVAGLATTDELGLFQAELRGDAHEIEVETLDSRCRIALPGYEVKQGIGRLGNLTCPLSPK